MRHAWIVAAFVALVPLPSAAQDPADACTLSFGANHAASYPRTITGEDTIKIDLSALPPGVAVYRAVLRPGRIESEAVSHRDSVIHVTLAGRDQPLRLLPPRYAAFDVTEELREVLKTGARSISFTFTNFPGYQLVENRLDVTCAAGAKREIPRVTELTARHRGGQTLLTWKETQLVEAAERMTIQNYVHLRDSLVTNSRQYRFRIYRSLEPISAATIGKAELVDEIAPLSGWNGDFYGVYPKGPQIVPRYVVSEDRKPVPAGTAVYAHNPKAPGAAYYAVSLHREENVDERGRFAGLLKALAGLKAPVIISTHPRTRERLKALGKGVPRGLRFVAPLAFADYIQLQKSARCVLSDSGTLTEEASLLGFAAVMLREAHERPEGQDAGALIMAGTRAEGIAAAVKVATERFSRAGRTWRVAPDYDVDDVASIVVNAILGYTDYVNRTIWRK